MNFLAFRNSRGLRLARATVSISLATAFAFSVGVGAAAADDSAPAPDAGAVTAADPAPAPEGPPSGPAADPAPAPDPAPADPASAPDPVEDPAPPAPVEDPAPPAPPAAADPAPAAVDSSHTASGPAKPTGGCTCHPQGISVSGWVRPEFTRTYEWKIDKQIREVGDTTWGPADTVTWTGPADSHPFEYRIVVTRTGSVDSGWTLLGSVTVRNDRTDPSAPPVNAVVTQPTMLGGVAASCTARPSGSADSWSGAPLTLSVAPGQSRSVDVTCTFDSEPGDGNYAATVASGTAVTSMPPAAFAFTTPTTRVHAEVTAVDDRATASTDDDVIYEPVSWDEACGCSVTVAHYTLVHVATTSGCSLENTWKNTATLSDENGEVIGTDTTTAAICVETPPTSTPPTDTPPATTVVLPPAKTSAGPPQETASTLPNTGGPPWAALYSGLALVALGGGLVLGQRRRVTP